MQFKALQLEDKAVFDRIFRRNPPESSWFNFTNLFIWQKTYQPQWTLEDDCLFILMHRHGVIYAFPPFVADQSQFIPATDKLINYFSEQGIPFNLKGLSPDMVQILTGWQPETFIATPCRDRYDYVYSAADLRELRGRKYHSKRNFVNRFSAANPNWRYVELTKDIIPDCMFVANQWCENKTCALFSDLELEHQAIGIAFDNFDKLGITGGALAVGDKIEAFSLGEMITPEMAVIHIEKANIYIDGIYTVINQEFCRNAWSNAVYINREEDLGIDGLRKAKESYFPVKLVEKYDIILASQASEQQDSEHH